MTQGTNSDREVLITRVLDAPRSLVFQAWTDPEHLLRWYAPGGCTIEFRTIEPHAGGTFHSCIRSPDGHECWCKGVYREVVAPERLVHTMEIADEQGNSVNPEDAGMDPEWPRQTVLTVTFEEEGQRTRLILHQTVLESIATRTGALPSWIEMLDRLAQDLASTDTRATNESIR
jgi:uncharacterized protein YndB with AHSA1/START domain